MPLIGEHVEEDRQLIADLVVSRMGQVLVPGGTMPSPLRPWVSPGKQRFGGHEKTWVCLGVRSPCAKGSCSRKESPWKERNSGCTRLGLGRGLGEATGRWSRLAPVPFILDHGGYSHTPHALGHTRLLWFPWVSINRLLCLHFPTHTHTPLHRLPHALSLPLSPTPFYREFFHPSLPI